MTEDQIAEAKELLADVSRVRAQARQSLLSANWSMFVLWGVIGVGSVSPIVLGADDTGLYWLFAAPIGAVFSFMLGAKHSADLGVGESALPYVLTAIGIFVLTFGGSFIIDNRWAIVWVFSVVAVGFGVFALLDRQWPVLLVAGVMVAVFVALGLTIDDPLALYLGCSLLLSGSFLGLGVGLWMARP